MTTYRAVTPGTAPQSQDPVHARRQAADAPTTASDPLAGLRRYGSGTEACGSRYPAWLHFPLGVDSAAASISVSDVRAIQ